MLSNWAPDLSVVSKTQLQRQLAYLEDVNSADKFPYWWISFVPSRCTLSRSLELRLLDSSKIILLCGGTRLKYFTKNIHAILFLFLLCSFLFLSFLYLFSEHDISVQYKNKSEFVDHHFRLNYWALTRVWRWTCSWVDVRWVLTNW